MGQAIPLCWIAEPVPKHKRGISGLANTGGGYDYLGASNPNNKDRWAVQLENPNAKAQMTNHNPCSSNEKNRIQWPVGEFSECLLLTTNFKI